jgi:hypothetical protein
MRWQDVTLLGKKILLGVVLIVVPLLILFGGLRITQRVLATGSQTQPSSLHAK